MSKKLMFVVNVDWFFVSHRLPIAIEAQRQGYQVHLAVGVTDHLDELQNHGFVVHPLVLDRTHTGIVNVFRTFWQLVFLFRRERPDVVHLVTIKPVLLGGIAARLAGVKCVVAAVTGLGFVFIDTGIKAALRRTLINLLYRAALSHRNLKVIFQNTVDRENLMQLTGLPADKTELIHGSGVDLSHYSYTPLPEGTPIIVMAARLLKSKGVHEFVDAARLLRQRGCKARFCLAGEADSASRLSVSEKQVADWDSEGVVEILGHCDDIYSVFRSAYLVVLPSYREGLPKVLIEAAASGRAVITTDVPGCRNAINPGITGLLVPPQDVGALADAIASLIDKPEICKAMGLAGRTWAEHNFDIKNVIAAHMEIYQQLSVKM